MDQWSIKHRPTTLSECLVGGRGTKEKIVGWFNQRARKAGPSCLMISGQCGTGKSTIVDLLCKQPNVVSSKNYASDERTSEKLTKMLNDLIFKPVFRLITKEESKVFIIDEADSSSDGPLFTWLATNAEKYEKDCSFVVIVNDASSKPVRAFLAKMKDKPKSNPKLLHVRLDPFTPDTINSVLRGVMTKEEKTGISNAALYQVVEGANGDLRKAINEIQWCFVTSDKKNHKPSDTETTSNEDDEKDTPTFTKLMGNQSVFTFLQQSRNMLYDSEQADRVKLAFALGEYDKFFLPLLMETNALQMLTTENVDKSPYSVTINNKPSRFRLTKSSETDLHKKRLAEVKFCLDLCDSFCQYDTIASDIHQNHGDNWEMEDYGLAAGFARPMLLLSAGKKAPNTWQPPIAIPTKHHFATNIQPTEPEVDANWRIELESGVPTQSWTLDYKPLLRSIYELMMKNIYEGKDSETKLKQLEVFIKETKLTPDRFAALDTCRFEGQSELTMSSKALRKVFDTMMANYKQEHRFGKKVDVNPQNKTLKALGLDEPTEAKPKKPRASKPKASANTVRSRVEKTKQCLVDESDVPIPVPSIGSPTLKPKPRSFRKTPPTPQTTSSDSIEISPMETDSLSPSDEQLPQSTSPMAPAQTSRFSTKRPAPPSKAKGPAPKKQNTGSLAKGQCKISSFFGRSNQEAVDSSDASTKQPSEVCTSGPKKMGLKSLLSAFDTFDGKVVHRK